MFHVYVTEPKTDRLNCKSFDDTVGAHTHNGLIYGRRIVCRNRHHSATAAVADPCGSAVGLPK